MKHDTIKHSFESVQGVVFTSGSEARAHGKGGIWYQWKNGKHGRFPEDVKSVMIMMPVNWGEEGIMENGIQAEWTVSEPNANGAKWTLSGTAMKPTLSPSLHWVGVWHGFLNDGFLKSC